MGNKKERRGMSLLLSGCAVAASVGLGLTAKHEADIAVDQTAKATALVQKIDQSLPLKDRDLVIQLRNLDAILGPNPQDSLVTDAVKAQKAAVGAEWTKEAIKHGQWQNLQTVVYEIDAAGTAKKLEILSAVSAVVFVGSGIFMGASVVNTTINGRRRRHAGFCPRRHSV